jgi:hypothetical protein
VERVTFSRSDRTAINPDWQPVDTSSVPVYLSRLVCETSGWSITTRWEVVENAVAGDFRVETKSRGRLRTVQVTALGPRRFEATDDHPDLRANDSVVYSLYARGDGGGWDLLGTQTASLSPATAGITGVYPNPFNPHTAVSFAVGAPGSVRIDIYDVTGRFVARLADRFYGAGNYTVRWDGRDAAGGEAASGIYLLRLSVNKKTETRKLALIR